MSEYVLCTKQSKRKINWVDAERIINSMFVFIKFDIWFLCFSLLQSNRSLLRVFDVATRFVFGHSAVLMQFGFTAREN